MPDDPRDEIVLSPKLESLAEEYAEDPTSKKFLPLAEEYRRSKLFDEAIYICQEGLKHHPDYLPAKITLARSYLDSQDKENALAIMLNVLDENPENVPSLRLMGDIYHAMDDLDKAEDYYNQVRRINPEDEVVAKKLLSLGKTPQTLEFAQPAIDISSSSLSAPVGPGIDLKKQEVEEDRSEDIELDLTDDEELEEAELSLPETEESAGIELSYVPPLDSSGVEFVQTSDKDIKISDSDDLMIELEETDEDLTVEASGGEIELETSSSSLELDIEEEAVTVQEDSAVEEELVFDSDVTLDIDTDDSIGTLSKDQIDIDLYDHKEIEDSHLSKLRNLKQQEPEPATYETVDLEDMTEEELAALDSSELKLEIETIISHGNRPREVLDSESAVESAEVAIAEESTTADISFDTEDVFASQGLEEEKTAAPEDDKSFLLLDSDQDSEKIDESDDYFGKTEGGVELAEIEEEVEEVAPVVPFTVTSAKILEDQGHLDKALKIYKKIESENPDDKEISAKILRLEDSLKGAKSLSQDQKIELLQRWLNNIEEFKNSLKRG